MHLEQNPTAGSRTVFYSGDLLTVQLRNHEISAVGTAFIRTNYGCISVQRNDLVQSVESKIPILEKGWRDLPMEQKGEGVWQIVLPLYEIGTFQYKCYFRDMLGRRYWVTGENCIVKVEPACLYGNNTIYNAFIRQYGPNLSENAALPGTVDAEKLLEKQDYTVVPKSGHFIDLQKQLDLIQGRLGFRFLMFLPIHPVPTSFAKMGRFGSAFAPTDFYLVDPAMAEFDQRTTPLEQFVALTDAVHARGGRVIIDIPLDHTGWASNLQVHHPEWFLRNEDGTFQSPGAWGVVWADLCKLDFSKQELWIELAKILLHWCAHGVDGFRCDAGYMIPQPVWQYLTAKVRQVYPDTLFLLEGLGGAWDTTASLLADGGMNWAYSELFQEFGEAAEQGYLRHACRAAGANGVLVNFAETHDNNRLAAVSPAWALHRVALSAMFSAAGCFAMANGVEWLATEKIDVHEACSLNWGHTPNLLAEISRINQILRWHPAFQAGASLRELSWKEGGVVALVRTAGKHRVLVLSNPDMEAVREIRWKEADFNPGNSPVDLLGWKGGLTVSSDAEYCRCLLQPGAVHCVSAVPFDLDPSDQVGLDPVRHQRLKSVLLLMLNYFNIKITRVDNLEAEAEHFGADPLGTLGRICGRRIPAIQTRLEDLKRILMLPINHLLYLRTPRPFKLNWYAGGRLRLSLDSIPMKDGYHFVLVKPQFHDFMQEFQLRVFDAEAVVVCCRAAFFSEERNQNVSLMVPAKELTALHTGLCANRFGSYSLVRGIWGTIGSKYDGFLVANLKEDYPTEQRVLLSRCRAWLQSEGFSRELNLKCQRQFRGSLENGLNWLFEIPCGLGSTALVQVVWQLDESSNAGRLSFCLLPGQNFNAADVRGVTLVVRPDVDARNHHQVTKAYHGAEQRYPACVHKNGEQGFSFDCDGAQMQMWTEEPGGTFQQDIQWQYQQPLPIEQERGLDREMDLFSPGYFSLPVETGRAISLHVCAGAERRKVSQEIRMNYPKELPLESVLRKGFSRFLVKRDEHTTVIAGYPWFLDWGRDTLICLPALIEDGQLAVAEDIIVQFAQFEENGTLPNMIRGNDTGDRATSDAPFWLFAAVRAFVQHPAGGQGILSRICGDRPLRRILADLASAVRDGKCPNGVAMDPATGLVFSPPHFTWMDTNYPAGTPRCGFPVEIQALWIAALRFLEECAPGAGWGALADMATENMKLLFVRADGHGLVDCLHAESLRDARTAQPDDAVRPNQLLAITLGVITDAEMGNSILSACEPLLIPGGIRSLDDASVKCPLPVYRDGQLLNDPSNPFWGHYSGDEDTRRKPAYHNGTAWGWLMPSFCEACVMVGGPEVIPVQRQRLASACYVMRIGCVGMLPEIYDAVAPHTPKGCPAQAWSMAEFLRVLLKLKRLEIKKYTKDAKK